MRIPAKLAAALLTAGAVATAPTMVGPEHGVIPGVSHVAVQPASVVTDLLYNAGDAINSVANAVVIATDAALGLNFYLDDSDFGWGVPFNSVFAGLAALQSPGDVGSILSYVAQLYLNPSYNSTNYYYPWYLNDLVLQPLAGILPAPLNSVVAKGINGVADAINDAFANLPDPAAGVEAMWNLYNTVPGRALYAAQFTLSIPVQLIDAVVHWAAYLPANVAATVESAIQVPANIPGLLSNLVYDALDPRLGYGMLGSIAITLAKPFFYLPSPIGETGFGAQDGLAYELHTNFVNAVSGLLSLLPTPIAPTPFAAAAARKASVQAADDDTAPAASNERAAVTKASPARSNAESPRRAAGTDSVDGTAAEKSARKADAANASQGQRQSKKDSSPSGSRAVKRHSAA
ncbi:hypothetical protein [Mycolicibacterium sarraceniae]|nr:hypothetical protein [Mycolicibacterium sarraceniae]